MPITDKAKTKKSPVKSSYALRRRSDIQAPKKMGGLGRTPNLGRGRGTPITTTQLGPIRQDKSLPIQSTAALGKKKTPDPEALELQARSQSINDLLNSQLGIQTENTDGGDPSRNSSMASKSSSTSVNASNLQNNPQPVYEGDLVADVNKMKLIINHMLNNKAPSGAIPKNSARMRDHEHRVLDDPIGRTTGENAPSSDADDVENDEDLKGEFLEFLKYKRLQKEKVNRKNRRSSSSSRSEECNPQPSDHRDSESSDHEPVRQQPNRRNFFNKRNEMDKWNIRFDNLQGGLSIKTFLFRVKTLKNAYNYSSDHVCKYFHILLSGEPLNWYYQFLGKHRRVVWKTLKREMLDRFKTNQSDLKISNRMQNRKQGKDSFEVYYNDICAMNHSLDFPKSDEEIISILRENMDDAIRQRIFSCQTTNLTKFLHLCNDAYEDVCRVRQTRNYFNSRPSKISEIDQISLDDDIELLEAKLSKLRASKSKEVQTPKVNPFINVDELSLEEIDEIFKQTKTHKLRNNDRLTCFNCHKVGHGFMFCSEDKVGLFCYRCGTRDVKTINCPTCSKPANEDGKQYS